MKTICILAILFCISYIDTLSQTTVAVLPFRNMDGNIKLDVYSSKLSDSLYKEIEKIAGDLGIKLITNEQVEKTISSLKEGETHPNYEATMWKAAEMLGTNKVVSGTFNMQNDRLLVNAYIYDSVLRLQDSQNKAINLFKAPESVMEVIPIIVRKLKPGLN
ncbi:MAG: hypothetical protein JNL36_01245 [Candidatus Kapabacteria bacterium]|nr:hypothetical protein [Candidatus Kapabacteria bacterium]